MSVFGVGLQPMSVMGVVCSEQMARMGRLPLALQSGQGRLSLVQLGLELSQARQVIASELAGLRRARPAQQLGVGGPGDVGPLQGRGDSASSIDSPMPSRPRCQSPCR